MSENLQYWINQNGTQSGPHTIEQLESMALDKAHTYVWHKGMDGWKRIDKIPELAHLTAAPEPVSYTHLDVYKRQFLYQCQSLYHHFEAQTGEIDGGDEIYHQAPDCIFLVGRR